MFLLVNLAFIIVSFFGIWSIQLFERGRETWVKSDCTGTTFDHAQAQDDFNLPVADQRGIINCFCQEMHDLYGFNSLKILFQDNRKLCLEWYPYALSQNYLGYALAIFISFLNLILQIVLNEVGKTNKTKN